MFFVMSQTSLQLLNFCCVALLCFWNSIQHIVRNKIFIKTFNAYFCRGFGSEDDFLSPLVIQIKWLRRKGRCHEELWLVS